MLVRAALAISILTSISSICEETQSIEVSILDHCGETIALNRTVKIYLHHSGNDTKAAPAGSCNLTLMSADISHMAISLKFMSMDFGDCEARISIATLWSDDRDDRDTIFESFPHYCGKSIVPDKPINLGYGGESKFEIVYSAGISQHPVQHMAHFQISYHGREEEPNWIGYKTIPISTHGAEVGERETTAKEACPTTQTVDPISEAGDPSTDADELTTQAVRPTPEAVQPSSQIENITTKAADAITEAVEPTTQTEKDTTKALKFATNALNNYSEAVDQTSEIAKPTKVVVKSIPETVTHTLELELSSVETVKPTDEAENPVTIATEPTTEEPKPVSEAVAETIEQVKANIAEKSTMKSVNTATETNKLTEEVMVATKELVYRSVPTVPIDLLPISTTAELGQAYSPTVKSATAYTCICDVGVLWMGFVYRTSLPSLFRTVLLPSQTPYLDSCQALFSRCHYECFRQASYAGVGSYGTGRTDMHAWINTNACWNLRIPFHPSTMYVAAPELALYAQVSQCHPSFPYQMFNTANPAKLLVLNNRFCCSLSWRSNSYIFDPYCAGTVLKL